MGLIALLTDFGYQDWFAAAMKGVIQAIASDVKIVDLTHDIRPHDVREAAFQLASVFHDFPARTVFVVVVDPGVGSRRAAIAGDIDGRYVVGPDNGFASWCLVRARGARFVKLDRPQFFRESVSRTFHGRDIFAPVAAHLARGRKLEEIGTLWPTPEVLPTPLPRIESNGQKLVGEIVHIDRFGNLITNLPNWALGRGEIRIANREARVVSAYAEGKGGELIAVPGSTGSIEISIREANAAASIGARTGDKVSLQLRDPGASKW